MASKKKISKAVKLETELKNVYEDLNFDTPNKLLAREIVLYEHLTNTAKTTNEEILLARISDLENEVKQLRSQKVQDALEYKLQADELRTRFFLDWIGNHRSFLAIFLGMIFVTGAIFGVQLEKTVNGSRNSTTPIEALTK